MGAIARAEACKAFIEEFAREILQKDHVCTDLPQFLCIADDETVRRGISVAGRTFYDGVWPIFDYDDEFDNNLNMLVAYLRVGDDEIEALRKRLEKVTEG